MPASVFGVSRRSGVWGLVPVWGFALAVGFLAVAVSVSRVVLALFWRSVCLAPVWGFGLGSRAVGGLAGVSWALGVLCLAFPPRRPPPPSWGSGFSRLSFSVASPPVALRNHEFSSCVARVGVWFFVAFEY